MKTIASLMAVLVMAFFLTGCGGKDGGNTETKDTTKTEKQTTEKKNGSDKRYGSETGMMETKVEAMGIPTTMKVYWKNFGAETYTESVVMGMKSFVLTDGEYVYSWSDFAKAGTKAKVDAGKAENINYNDLDEEMMKQYNMTEEGTETIAGKECVVYTMKYSGVSSKTWVWNGIPMKTEANAGGIKTLMEVVKIEENIDMPAGIFDMPKGITFTESSMK